MMKKNLLLTIFLYTVFKGDKRQLELAISQKDNLVVKPQDLYSSQEVFVGRDYTEDEWLKC